MSNFLTEYTSIIENMVAKYTGNEYSLQRLDFHLKNLEQTIDTENNNYSKRIIRTNNLAIEQEMFIEVFLSQNKYYFMLDHINELETPFLTTNDTENLLVKQNVNDNLL